MLHNQVIKLLTPVDLGNTAAGDRAVKGAVLDATAASAATLLKEAFPDSAYALLSDWERVLGLMPLATDTISARANRCVAKLRDSGRMDPAYFTALAAQLGVTVVIQEMHPFMAGWDYAGMNLMPDPGGWFVWRVTITGSPGSWFRSGSSAAGESLGASLAGMLQSLFTELKPAHTFCYFQQ